MRKLLLFMLLVMTASALFAQNTIQGKVTDGESGDGLPGVSIVIKGTATGTTSDLDGNYSLTASSTDILVFSFIGYESQEILVGSRSSIDLTLQVDVAQLSEVVVIGYGAIKKEDATGSLELATEEDFNKGFNTSADQLIQGRVPGVQITSAGGAPGSKASIRIRGASSIRAGNDPLIVVDGVPLDGRDVSPGGDIGAGRQPSTNPLNFLNPNDIESISILKDASATAIYGSRGANGVLLITTKKGTRGKPQLQYDGSVGVSWMPENREYNLLDAADYVNATGNEDFGADVNGFDEIIRTGITQNHSFAYGGATENGGRYRISLSYQDQEGIIEDTGLERIGTSINLSQEAFNGRVKIQSSVIASITNDEATALAENVGAEGDVLTSALRWNPSRPLINPDGTFNQLGDNQRNPLAFQEYYSDNTQTSRVFMNLGATVGIIDGLDYKINIGGDYSTSERGIAVSSLFDANFTRDVGVAQIENLTASNYLMEHTLTYNRTFGDFDFNGVLGYSFQEFFRSGNTMRGQGFFITDQETYLSNLNYASQFLADNQSSFEDPEDQLQSYFGRINLTYLGKFLFTATVRTDGSSRFGEDNFYGTFPAFALGWKLSEESFTPDLFTDLKLRLGWGVTGNRELPPGQAVDQFEPTNNGAGERQTIVGNDELKWEETTQTNIGIDYGFLEGRLTGTIDWYNKETNDLLFRLPVTQPGPDAFFWQNFEDITIVNSGWDFGLNYIAVDRDDLTVNVGVNASIFNNEIEDPQGTLDLVGIQTGELNGQGLTGQRAQLIYGGQELNAFYLPVFTGYDDGGNSTFQDLNGNGMNDASAFNLPGTGDQTFVGSPNPDWNLGFNMSVSYQNFDFAMLWSGAFGHQVFDNTALALFSQGALQGGNNVDRRVISGEQANQAQADPPVPSTQFLFDADYFRLDNLTLGYTFDTQKIEWLTKLRVYATGQNLLLFTGYDGFDPQVNQNKSIDEVPSFGIDYASYPRARIFNFGVNVIF